jgi:Domain of unknown function (DUF4145)
MVCPEFVRRIPHGGIAVMMKTTTHFNLPRCPHCNTANPTLQRVTQCNAVPQKTALIPFPGPGYYIQWHIYICASCAGLVAAATTIQQNYGHSPIEGPALWVVPELNALSPDIPPRAASYLAQARETLSSPSASVVMSASAVDAMLKERGYTDGKLYSRIEAAQTGGLLTENMADWAHDIRLDANDERHADCDATGATSADAKRCLEFAETIAELLFVLPARVKRGRAAKPAGSTGA